MRRAYGAWRRGGRPTVDEILVASAAIVVALACRQSSWRAGAVSGAMIGAVLVTVRALVAARVGTTHSRGGASRWVAGVLMVLGAFAGLRAEHEWDRLAPRQLGAYEGWVRLIDDPQPFVGSTRVLVAVEGERFEVWARGRARRLRVDSWRAGEYVRIHGERVALDTERQQRVAWQHVVGELRVAWVADTSVGGPVDRASNRVRAAIERGGEGLPGDDGALYRGLVVGDDRDQPREMIRRFRASGLSHLTAVSGQNVSFVLAAAGPLLRVLRPWARWAVTLALIGWFVSLTRFEPSIVRAGAMAALSATAFVLGRDRAPARILGVAVTLLLLVDPLLVRSVGFWLSVGATAGVCTVGPWLARRLPGLGFLAMPVGITIGAQVGVVIPSVMVFGRLPLVSVPANLLAVPVAGFVMLYGLPAGLLAGSVPATSTLVMLPCRVGVRWVDTIAILGEHLEPGGRATTIGWIVVAVALVAVWSLTAGKNRSRHGSPPADRRRRVDPAHRSTRPRRASRG